MMFDENNLIYLLVTLVGLCISYFGSKIKTEMRRSLIATGVIVAHVGLFGILYDKLSLTPFLALVFFVVSVFVLVDPFKLGPYFPEHFFKRVGYLLFLAAAALFLMIVTGFNIYFWVLPISLYLLPFTIPPWRPLQVKFKRAAFLIGFCYLGFIGYQIYVDLNAQNQKFGFLNTFKGLSENTALDSLSKPNNQPAPFEVVNPVSVAEPAPDEPSHLKPLAPNQNSVLMNASSLPVSDVSSPLLEPEDKTLILHEQGPLLEALDQFDQKYLELKRDYKELQEKYRKVLMELESLKAEKPNP